jgi:hypothetical protein
MPAPGDPDYLSIADEIKEMQQRPTDVTVIDTWQVRLPTTLIWLQNKNDDGQHPKNLNPTIDTTPKIVALSPAAGSVDDLVTIFRSEFWGHRRNQYCHLLQRRGSDTDKLDSNIDRYSCTRWRSDRRRRRYGEHYWRR